MVTKPIAAALFLLVLPSLAIGQGGGAAAYRIRIPTNAELSAAGFGGVGTAYKGGALTLRGYYDPPELGPFNRAHTVGDLIVFGTCVGVLDIAWSQPGWTPGTPRNVLALDPPSCARSGGAKTFYIWADYNSMNPPPTLRVRWMKEADGTPSSLIPSYCVAQVDPTTGDIDCVRPFAPMPGFASCPIEACSPDLCDVCKELFWGPDGPNVDALPPEVREGYVIPSYLQSGQDIEICQCEDEGSDPLFCCEEGDPDSDGDGICNACDAPSAGCDDSNYNNVCDDCECGTPPDELDDFQKPNICKPGQTVWCCAAEGYADVDGDEICNLCDADYPQPAGTGSNYCIDIAPRDGVCDGCQGDCNVCSKLDELIAAMNGRSNGDVRDYNQPEHEDFNAGYMATEPSAADFIWIEPFPLVAWDAPITSFNVTIPIPGTSGVTSDLLGNTAPGMPSEFNYAIATFRLVVRAVLLALISYKWMFAIVSLIQTI